MSVPQKQRLPPDREPKTTNEVQLGERFIEKFIYRNMGEGLHTGPGMTKAHPTWLQLTKTKNTKPLHNLQAAQQIGVCPFS